MSRALRAAAALLPAALLAVAMPARGAAQAEPSDLPPALQGVEVVERLGAQVPLAAGFVDQDGRPVRLEHWLGKDRPVVMALVYYECPMLCGLVLGGLARGMKETGLELGKDFRALAVSFDPREKPAQATVRQKAYLQALDRPEARDDWAFLVGRRAGHPGRHRRGRASTTPTTRDEAVRPRRGHLRADPGRAVSRYLYGVEFPGRDLRLALVEASQAAGWARASTASCSPATATTRWRAATSPTRSASSAPAPWRCCSGSRAGWPSSGGARRRERGGAR